jgi:hypothetical protein
MFEYMFDTISKHPPTDTVKRPSGPTGSFALPVASFYRITNGRIVECSHYGDSTALAHVLGLDLDQQRACLGRRT